MGRGKLSLNLIPNEKSRISTFKKRKNSLMKKAYELSTLCDVRTCVLIYGPAQYPSQSDFQFYTWPSNRTDLEAMIRAYKTNSSSNFYKHKCFRLTDFFSDRKRKIESEMCKLHEKFEEVMCPKWDEQLERLSEHELREFMEGLDVKIEAANRMINFMEADHEDLFRELFPENTVQIGGDSNTPPPPPVLNPSDLFMIGANPNEEDVAMNEFNIRYEEDNYMAHYVNLMNDEFDYCNNIEHLKMPTGNF